MKGEHRKSFLPEATALSLQPTHKYTGLNKYFIPKRGLFEMSVMCHLKSLEVMNMDPVYFWKWIIVKLSQSFLKKLFRHLWTKLWKDFNKEWFLQLFIDLYLSKLKNVKTQPKN